MEDLSKFNDKVQFVKGISDVIVGSGKFSIEEITYHVFEDADEVLREYLIIHYKGGAKAARNCRGNSEGAIFEEISHFLFSGSPVGYHDGYAEYEYYKNILAKAISAQEELL